MFELTAREWLSLLGLLIAIVYGILVIKSIQRRRKQKVPDYKSRDSSSKYPQDLGTEDSPRMVILDITPKDLGEGSSADKFKAYLMEYLSKVPMPNEYLHNDNAAINHLAIVTDRLSLSFVMQTGESLFINDLSIFCKKILEELRSKQ